MGNRAFLGGVGAIASNVPAGGEPAGPSSGAAQQRRRKAGLCGGPNGPGTQPVVLAGVHCPRLTRDQSIDLTEVEESINCVGKSNV